MTAPTSQLTSTPVTALTADLTQPATTPAVPLPFAHSPCAKRVDLTGQTVPFYHIIDLTPEAAKPIQSIQAGLDDAAAYFNAHGGICGATLAQVIPGSNKSFDEGTDYHLILSLSPKPVLIGLYDSMDAEVLRNQLATDQIPALGIAVGSSLALYGEDGQSPGWTFATQPLYTDQLGAFCRFVSQHPGQYPRPVIGYLGWHDASGLAAYSPEAIAFCGSLGVKVLDQPSYFLAGATDVASLVQTLADRGANILYTNSPGTSPTQIARALVDLKRQDTVALATFSLGLDPLVGLMGQSTLRPDGLPSTVGLVGSLPLRTWSETGLPAIQFITDQADQNQRPLALRTNDYIRAWASTDLYIELYIQTGNRVGFDHITGAEIKKTLASIVYSPLGGIETIDYKGGTLRALSADRLGQLEFMGRDGKTAAGPNNPPLLVSEAGQQLVVPMLAPLTDFQAAPDLRPGGADVPAVPVSANAPFTATGRIVFMAGDGSIPSRFLEIYAINPDGSGLTRLTNNNFTDTQPAVSPDGKQIAFQTDRDGNNEIYVMNADGSDQTRLTNNPADDGYPRWSPDGQKLAFTSNRDGNYEIYVMNADGSKPTRLTDNPAIDAGADWSPDGQKIAFLSDRGGNFDIYVMKLDGSGLTNLTNNPADDGGPHWSPDGTKILFQSDRVDKGEVYVMNADGSNPIDLTHNPAFDSAPVWSPDGAHIAFATERDGGNQTYLMNADGSGQIRLTYDPSGWAFEPDWGRSLAR